MSKNSRQQRRDNQHQQPTDSNSRPDHSHDSVTAPNGEHPQSDCAQKQQVFADVNIVEKKKWSRADRIAFLVVIVNIALAFVTYRLYVIATNQSQEVQREFDIENQPLVQAVDVKFDSLEVGKKVIIAYTFVNYGKQPAKIVSNRAGVIYWKNDTGEGLPDSTWKTDKLNNYLSSAVNTNFRCHFKSADLATKGLVDSLKNGKKFAYLKGSLYFETPSMIGKKSMFYYTYILSYVDHSFSVKGIQDTTIAVK